MPTDMLAIVNFLVALSQVPAGNIDAVQLRTLNDVSDQIVRCYHPTATFLDSKIVENPWSKGREWQADTSAVIHIRYEGHTLKFKHEMLVAVIQRGNHFRATVLKETNLIPPSKGCALRNWVQMEPSIKNK